MGRLKGSKNRPKTIFADSGSKAATIQATKATTVRAENGRLFPGRKKHPCTSNMDYSGDELEFISAMAEYIRLSGKKFPTWSEALAVVCSLGYKKDANILPLHGRDQVSEPEEYGRLGVCALKSPGRVHRKRMP